MLHSEFLVGGHFIGGPCDQTVPKQLVKSPWDDRTVGTAAESLWEHALLALESAHDAFRTWKESPRRERQALLRRIAALTRERREELAELMALEIGKPVTWGLAELDRMSLTFETAADLLTDWGLEALPADLDPRGDGCRILVERFPLGVVLAITPYNWPFNLAAHKIAPALATGNTVVLKGSRLASLSTLALARILHEAGTPPGVVNVINCSGADAERLARDPRVTKLSFTGSPAVGWHLRSVFQGRHLSLELGGDATAVVCRDADLDWAVSRIALGAYGYAGQVCIAVQHVLVESPLYEEARSRLAERTRLTPAGDPLRPETVCGPVIDDANADRIMDWIAEAKAAGMSVLAGGDRDRRTIAPTLLEAPVLERLPVRIDRDEVFGPVLVLREVPSFEQALAWVNGSRFGIHAGLFTRDLDRVERAFRTLEVGGVIVGDAPNLRFDVMPYGGLKESGLGREGVRSTFEAMTEPKVLVLRTR